LKLLDNVVEDFQNGATFVIMDKIQNPRDNSPTLLFQDNGGGMDLLSPNIGSLPINWGILD
jgi:hypothetical protein